MNKKLSRIYLLATFTVALLYNQSIVAQSLSFDGVDDYVVISHSNELDTHGSITVESWIKVIEGQTNGSVLSKADNNFLFWDNDFENDYSTGQGFQIEYDNTPSSIEMFSMDFSQWYYIAFSYSEDTDEFRVYKDGEYVRSETADISIQSTTDVILIENLLGNMAELRIWNRVLTDQEIETNMSTSISGNETGLVGYWNFNEGSGTTLTDLSGNGNHGTIYGATWDTDSQDDDENDDDGSIELLTNATEYGVGGDDLGYPLNSFYHDVKHSHFTGRLIWQMPEYYQDPVLQV